MGCFFGISDLLGGGVEDSENSCTYMDEREAGPSKLGQCVIGSLVIPPLRCPSTSICRGEPCIRSPWIT